MAVLKILIQEIHLFAAIHPEKQVKEMLNIFFYA